MGEPVQIRTVVCASALVAIGAPVAAETLPVTGIYGSGVEISPEIEVVAIERMGGDAGPVLAIELSEALSDATINGRSYFRVIPATSGPIVIYHTSASPDAAVSAATQDDPEAPDAVLRGSVRSEVTDIESSPRTERECVRRDDRGKCVEHRNVSIPCRELRVTLDPRIALIGVDGRQLYSESSRWHDAKTYCATDYGTPSANDMFSGLLAGLVRRVRLDLAPEQRSQDIRIMESRSNLRRSDRGAFRDAVRLTKNDPLAACLAFEALEAANPTQTSVLFNVGLCRESEGALDAAEVHYRRVLEIEPGKDHAVSGLARLVAHRRGLAQLEERGW